MNHGPESDAHLLQRPRLDRTSCPLHADLYTVSDGFFISLCNIALFSCCLSLLSLDLIIRLLSIAEQRHSKVEDAAGRAIYYLVLTTN